MVASALVAAGGRSSIDSYLLGLVPVGVAIVFGLLVLPRRVVPEEIPVPVVDERALARVESEDGDRARVALAGEVRALGSAIRAFHDVERRQLDDPYVHADALVAARDGIDEARRAVLASGPRDDELLELRAAQLAVFVQELRAFARTGDESQDLRAVAGAFVKRLRDVGWCDARGHDLAPDFHVARVMFKLQWNALVGVERPPFLPSLDEQRALYAFYIRHPHALESARKRFDDARLSAKTPRQCEEIDASERVAAEQWRMEKIRQLHAIDPAYPAEIALGVALYRRRDYHAALDAFRSWLEAHPDGAWTIRARDYEREALYQVGLD
jgi:hypothetical protein